ncbi:MAG: alpha-glucosidase, partial [Verrucomicrobia bacterium]
MRLGVALGWTLAARGFGADHWQVASPDNQVVVRVRLAESAGHPAALFYELEVGGRTVIEPSRLGWILRDRPLGALEIRGVRHAARDQVWKPVWGERSAIRDHHRELTFELREQTAPHRRLEVQFRAYDEGMAFRTRFLPADDRPGAIWIRHEHSEFRFAGDWRTWAVYSAQGRYQETRISGVRSGCERPLTVEVAPDLYVALGEAALVDYARMKLGPLPGAAHALVSELGSEVVSALPMATPWRVFLVGRSPGELLEHNDLFLNLNEPCALADTSWIRPGKVIREITLTTQGG